MKVIGKVILLAIACLPLGLPLAESERADASAHHDGGRFTNPFAETEHKGFFGILRARLSADWKSYKPGRDLVPTAVPEPVAARAVSTNATVTWLGHATVLVQHQGVNILTDPMFSDFASPVAFAGPKRITQPALSMDELPPIHGVVISHDHYDHLDTATIRRLGNDPMYFVPLGLRKWFVAKGIDPQRVVELDWWQEKQLTLAGRSVSVTATPSQHFSGRGLTDRNKNLWASWAITWDDFRVWFGGDTGYNDVQFKQIGERLGSIDLAIIPIGAYEPRWFMKTIHVNPLEALQIHKDLNAVNSMAVHWGSFVLAGEGVMTPLIDLDLAREQHSIAPDEFAAFAIGETRHYPIATAPARQAQVGLEQSPAGG